MIWIQIVWIAIVPTVVGIVVIDDSIVIVAVVVAVV
jgi:hypothetical protein